MSALYINEKTEFVIVGTFPNVSTAVVSRIPTKINYIGYFVLGGYLVRNRCCAYFCLSVFLKLVIRL